MPPHAGAIRKEGDIRVGGGGGTQYRTAIPLEKLANTEIPCHKSTKYRYPTFMIGHAYLTLYPSHAFFILSLYTPEINLSLREKT